MFAILGFCYSLSLTCLFFVVFVCYVGFPSFYIPCCLSSFVTALSLVVILILFGILLISFFFSYFSHVIYNCLCLKSNRKKLKQKYNFSYLRDFKMPSASFIPKIFNKIYNFFKYLLYIRFCCINHHFATWTILFGSQMFDQTTMANCLIKK